MELNKKIINRLENSIKYFIDNNKPFEYSDRFAKFVRIDPYILWNKYNEKYTLNLFYIFDEFTTLPANNKSREHGYNLIQLLSNTLPFIKEMNYDIHIKTKKEYKKYEDELIPAIKKLIPENKQPLHETRITQKIANILEKKVRKIISSHEPFIDDKFVKMIPHIIFSKLENRTELWVIYIFKGNNISTGENWKVYCHFGELKRKLEMSLPYLIHIPIHDKLVTERQYEGIMETIPLLKSFLPEQKIKLTEEKNSEEYYIKIENSINKFLSKFKTDIDDDNFLGYKVIVGKSKYSSEDLEVKITGIFKNPYKMESSDKIHIEARKIAKLLRETIPYLKYASISGGSTTTLDSFNKNLNWEKSYLGRVVESKLPFKQTTNNGIKTRVFNESVDNHELKWHRDENDRIVKVIKSNGWKFQIDNQLPITLKEGSTFKIPSGVFHRVIKGGGDLIIKIKEV